MISTAGNNGEKDRSDCFVSLELKTTGGIQIDLQSKVKSIYGESIVLLCNEILKFFGVEHAVLKIEDKGALPFVLAARLEAAIKKVIKVIRNKMKNGKIVRKLLRKIKFSIQRIPSKDSFNSLL